MILCEECGKNVVSLAIIIKEWQNQKDNIFLRKKVHRLLSNVCCRLVRVHNQRVCKTDRMQLAFQT